MQHIVDEIAAEMIATKDKGEVADYIPQLAMVDPNQFGISLILQDGSCYNAGCSNTLFSIQSISKVFSLTIALGKLGDALWRRVGREPSGDPFNSIVQLEHERGIPRNPFIDNTIGIDEKVAHSELAHSDRNAALAHFMASFGNLDHPVDSVLGTYFHQCSISMSCEQLAQAGMFLACDGLHMPSNNPVVSSQRARRINALMMMCGHYDGSGEFAYRVGLPGKSGVGGGILAVAPGKASIAVWSPGLDKIGNSKLGTRALELLTQHTGWSVFGN